MIVFTCNKSEKNNHFFDQITLYNMSNTKKFLFKLSIQYHTVYTVFSQPNYMIVFTCNQVKLLQWTKTYVSPSSIEITLRKMTQQTHSSTETIQSWQIRIPIGIRVGILTILHLKKSLLWQFRINMVQRWKSEKFVIYLTIQLIGSRGLL